MELESGKRNENGAIAVDKSYENTRNWVSE